MKLLLKVVTALICVLFVQINLNAQTTLNFSSSSSWTVPCGVTTATFQIWGGGGGGGGDASNGFPAGSGGGSGGYSTITAVGLVPGNTYTFVVGAGGVGIAGNTAPAAGNSGGTTTLSGVGVSLTANGGSPGASNGTPGGAGGTALGGTTNTTGNTGGNQTGTVSGVGAGAPNGGGNVPGCSSQACTGGAGTAFGGGGAGGGPRGGGTNSTGGAGAGGGVRITFTSTTTIPNAGVDQAACGTLTLNGNTPDLGWTGTWSVVSGTATITTPGSPTSTVTGIPAGTCATIRWTFTNPPCSPITDDVIFCAPAICNDDPCNAFALPVSSGTCTFTAGTNVGATFSSGMAEPSCASVNGPDVWYAITVPPSGQVQVSGQSTVDAFDELITIYEGGCANLSFNGCVSGAGANAYPLTYAGVPGSTIYVRVAEGGAADSPTGNFGICAVEATTAGISEVVPGTTTTVTCGSSLNFFDTGGSGGSPGISGVNPPPAGNYTNNTGASWTICPSDPTQLVQISFSAFQLEAGFDKMIILAGDTVIAQWTSNEGLGDVVTSQYPGECLTVVFQSDFSITALGWAATVTCTNTIVPPQITTACEVTNCNSGCGVWICADGIYDTEAGAGAGIDEINEVTGGCWGASGEVASSWFYFTVGVDGTLAFEFVPSNSGHNVNFALYGPSTDGVPPCPLSTGEAPIRCSFATAGGINTGLQAGQTDMYDIATGDGMAMPVDVVSGQTYALVVDVYQNGQPPTQTEIDFTGSAILDCTPVFLDITLAEFNGMNQGENNLLYWTVSSQVNNEHFSLYRSTNGIHWDLVETVKGHGTTYATMYYSVVDRAPFFPITYYRLKQTDTDGGESFSEVIAISRNKGDEAQLVNTIFPNPASDFTTFIYEGTANAVPLEIQAYDQLGKVVFSKMFTSLNTGSGLTIDTSELGRGIYQLIFRQGDKTQIERLSIVR